ncbi:hypothetical protein AOC36_10370 [Erysipelothrix larvae]|uniref:Arginine--tRNA ligase n=1 Tax=Erysipelothrix larvae TaxID=1514105 RepID=A0A0X8H1I3_9FIRM|nr:arginine--tRNA ligase [Erysipelothrix larvae]AMC94360.1 hypothetical protein AOC36_10370 [Erysipelothrix larvae]
MSLKTELELIVKDAFKACGFEGDVGHVTESKRVDLCQFQSNDSFVVAKTQRKNPKEVGEAVVDVLNQHPKIKEASFAPPGFINITVSDAFLIECLHNMINDAFVGVPQIGAGETIVLDYGGPNVSKPLHVGHLRSAVIGEAVKRIARACGYNAIGDVHLGDWGLPLGLVIYELKLRYPEWHCFQEGFGGDCDESIQLTPELLYEVYPTASTRSKTDAEYLAQAREVTARLQDGHPGYTLLWNLIVKTSVSDIKKDYDKLDVSFDYWYGESDADHYIPQLMEILYDKHLIRESDGAKVVDVIKETDKSPMPPVIVEKSDGSSIYATTDLATIFQRQKDFKPNKIWYVVDKRQGLHFEQVFRVARLANLVPESTEFKFLGFGTMNGQDGKPFKTRDGGVMSLSSLLKQVEDASREKLEESDRNVNHESALDIGVAALKFGDLINNPSSDYIFDVDKFLSFEGKTGSYILYNNVRIIGILKRLNEDPALIHPMAQIVSEHQRNLVLKLLRNPEQFMASMDEGAPNYITDNTYQIAAALAKFYAEHNIMKEVNSEVQTSWINLLKATHKVIEHNLNVLGINAVQEM